jgi:acyl transferase domain-containing protein
MEKVTGTNTSVFSGCFTTDYLLQLMRDPQYLPTYAATGVAGSLLANRLSWFFDLKGSSVNLDSACSSSGMALDWACSQLRDKSCSMVSLHIYVCQVEDLC